MHAGAGVCARSVCVCVCLLLRLSLSLSLCPWCLCVSVSVSVCMCLKLLLVEPEVLTPSSSFTGHDADDTVPVSCVSCGSSSAEKRRGLQLNEDKCENLRLDPPINSPVDGRHELCKQFPF